MPIKECQINGESGYKWGDAGKCYTGPDAKDNAIKQGVAIGEFVDNNRVSIDYDDTLSTDKGKELAKRLISEGKDVYIITRRHKLMGSVVYNTAKDLGIPADRVYFTEGKLKWATIDRLKISTHYDNNQNEIDKINEMTDSRGILFKASSELEFKIEYGNTRTGNNPSGLKSSNVWKYKYDDKKLELVVKFQDGETYTYYNVSPQLFNDFSNGNGVCITEGQNEYGEWFIGKSPSMGAAVHELLLGLGYSRSGQV